MDCMGCKIPTGILNMWWWQWWLRNQPEMAGNLGRDFEKKKTQNEKINTLPQTNTIAMSLRILTLKPLEKKSRCLAWTRLPFWGSYTPVNWFCDWTTQKKLVFLVFDTSEDHQTKGTQTKLRNCEHKKMVSSENGRKVTHLEDHPS